MNSKDSRLKLIERINALTDLHSKETYTYRLTHRYDHTPRKFYIQANIPPFVMDALIAFLQFEAAEKLQEYNMDQIEAIAILKDFYNVQECKRSKSTEIDLYYNWEWWCGVANQLSDVKLFQRDGLLEKFKQLYEKTTSEEVS